MGGYFRLQLLLSLSVLMLIARYRAPIAEAATASAAASIATATATAAARARAGGRRATLGWWGVGRAAGCVVGFVAPVGVPHRLSSSAGTALGMGRGGGKGGSGDKISKGKKKGDLPEKVCEVCGRPFTWRKKWEKARGGDGLQCLLAAVSGVGCVGRWICLTCAYVDRHVLRKMNRCGTR